MYNAFAEQASAADNDIYEPWADDPEPLPENLKPVERFDFNLLPEKVRPWIEDVADRMQFAPDLPAAGIMVVLGSLIGRKAGIRPRRYDDFLCVPNLFGMMIARPSGGKTPSLDEITSPLEHLEENARNVHKEELKRHEAMLRRAKVQKDLADQDARKRLKKGEKPQDIDDLYMRLADSVGFPPVQSRIIVNDCTVEKLGELLSENPNGLLHVRDEMSGWFRSLSREDRANDRAFFLEAWSGKRSYTYDRITRGTIFIKNNCLSILGGIQPGKLVPIVEAAVMGRDGADGLLQRFQLMVYPDPVTKPKFVDRLPNQSAKLQAVELIDSLVRLPMPEDGDDVGLRFTPKAQELFDDWWISLDVEVRGPDIHEAMESHLIKYRSLIPSLALTCHLADQAVIDLSEPVGLGALEKALGWGGYLKSHAERVYGLALNPQIAGAKTILGKISRGKLSNPFTKRDVSRGNWSGLTTPESIDGALNTLISYGYIRTALRPSQSLGGRTTTDYFSHPKLIQG